MGTIFACPLAHPGLGYDVSKGQSHRSNTDINPKTNGIPEFQIWTTGILWIQTANWTYYTCKCKTGKMVNYSTPVICIYSRLIYCSTESTSIMNLNMTLNKLCAWTQHHLQNQISWWHWDIEILFYIIYIDHEFQHDSECAVYWDTTLSAESELSTQYQKMAPSNWPCHQWWRDSYWYRFIIQCIALRLIYCSTESMSIANFNMTLNKLCACTRHHLQNQSFQYDIERQYPQIGHSTNREMDIGTILSYNQYIQYLNPFHRIETDSTLNHSARHWIEHLIYLDNPAMTWT